MLSRENELEAFKRIDLCQFVASRGFVLDQKISSLNSRVYRHDAGDKLIITRNKVGHYVYFNAKGNDHGTIIDFIQTRDGVSLGEVRKLLRPWLSGQNNSPTPAAMPIRNSQSRTENLAKVRATWDQASILSVTHPYLEYERKIPREILLHPLFQDRIRIDQRGNALFPHFKSGKLTGFEVKNRGWTGFSPGGVKGLALSNAPSQFREFVLCETAIDMLSYASLHGCQHKLFASTAGQLNPTQPADILAVVEKLPVDARIILAFDHDEGGFKLTTRLREILLNIPQQIVKHRPLTPGEDWNDVLRKHDFTITQQFVLP